jgi:hypothetical protein
MRRLVILFAALLLWSIPASAQLRFYVGAGGVSTVIKTDGLMRAAGTVGLSASNELDDATFGGQVFAGMLFTKHLGVEVKYNDSGDADGTVILQDPDVNDPGELLDVEASIDGYTVYGVASFPFVGSEVVEWVIKGGYTSQDGEITLGGLDPSSVVPVPDDDDGFAVSTVLRFRIGNHFAISGEWEYFNIDFDKNLKEPVRYGINAEFHF